MVRTQIYLTKEERTGLSTISKVTGKKQSELIREALDMFLGLSEDDRREAILNEAAGLWKNRRDLPDFTAERTSWDRG
ncbi:MAG: ribbon-helix-helix domain-containing protein [Phycisphaerae bacterium]|nr:ribbon-helix-helix domain-containing protein [Phycisphaerae bacterium]